MAIPAVLARITSKYRSMYDLCVCGDKKVKTSINCPKCYGVRRTKNPKTSDGKYTHKKGNCIDCNKQISDTYRDYCRSCSHKGERSYQWKGGISPENVKIRTSIEMDLWRQSVFARDNWTDQKTGIRGGKLVAHHILNFASHPELRFSIDNGITLSEESHKKFHKKYGKKNNTMEQLLEFLTQN